jgi:hypothetical protein
MFKNRSIATFLAMVLFTAPAWAQAQFPKQTPSGPSPARPARPVESLTSPSAAARFWEIGYEIAHAENIRGPEADQAIILLTAAKSLNSQLAGAEPLLLKLAARSADKNYSDPVIFWLQKYVNESADRAVVADAIRCLLSRSNSREERRIMLERVAGAIKDKNLAINSELATALGLVMLEKGDSDRAKFYLVQAYNNNKYNRTAFAKLLELAPNEIGPASHLEHLRLVVRENPLDLKEALRFAGYAEQLQLYDVAASTYQYCAELFRYLYPSEQLPAHIYLPWASSCYNSQRGLPTCLQIAENMRGVKRFDILLEAFAGRAAGKVGKPEEAQRILQQAGQKAQELFQSQEGQSQVTKPGSGDMEAVRPVTAKQLAWFYCFADPNPAKALDWANKAYSAEPNSPSTTALLAYALSVNNQLEWAKPLLASAEQSQVADMVQAKIQLAAGNRQNVIQTIQGAIAKDPGSLAAEKAKDWLRQLGSQYVPPADTRTLVAFLAERLGNAIVPQFVPPDKMLDVQFTLRGADFSYGNEVEGIIAVVNKGVEPLIITDNSLFQGNIRVSARVAGHLTREIPNLVSDTIRTDLVVPPGRSLVCTQRLSTGELRSLLMTCPQAALDIQFTLYLDPVVTDRGEISNRLVDVKPVTISLKRPPVQVTGDYVRSRFNAIASGQESQKVQTARLFTGLLKEQNFLAINGTLYPFQYADWLPGQLRLSLVNPSGLLLGGSQGGWAVKVNAMADLLYLPLDQELTGVVAKNLNHPLWPVRLMAVYLLAKSSVSSFTNVLDWVVKNDTDDLVRSMALSLQATPPAGMMLRAPAPEQFMPPLPATLR